MWLIPVRSTKSVGWSDRRAKAKLVRKGVGRYGEKQDNVGDAGFIMIWCPVCMMLLVHCMFSFAFSLWIFRRVKHFVYDI